MFVTDVRHERPKLFSTYRTCDLHVTGLGVEPIGPGSGQGQEDGVIPEVEVHSLYYALGGSSKVPCST